MTTVKVGMSKGSILSTGPYAKVFISRGRENSECGIGAKEVFVCSKSLGLVSALPTVADEKPPCPYSLPVLLLYCIQIRQKLLRKVSYKVNA